MGTNMDDFRFWALWGFIASALIHLATILFNLYDFRHRLKGSHFQIAWQLAKEGGWFGWAFSGSLFVLLICAVAMNIPR